jgi:hypothetical protein
MRARRPLTHNRFGMSPTKEIPTRETLLRLAFAFGRVAAHAAFGSYP